MASNATGNERAASAQAPVLEVDEDWEEWDRSDAFWIHATAGSAAGVVEHTAMFPLDTLKVSVCCCVRGLFCAVLQCCAGGLLHMRCGACFWLWTSVECVCILEPD